MWEEYVMLFFYTRNKKYIYVANGQIQAAGHAHRVMLASNVQVLYNS